MEDDKDANLFIDRLEEQKSMSRSFITTSQSTPRFSSTNTFLSTPTYIILFRTSSLCNIFWFDSIAQDDYALYGDSITFDTTYKTNKYNLILGLFLGINNHKGTIIFTVGFLFREGIESFMWLFERFLHCMGKPWKIIITNQDPTMPKALEQVMPDMFHRLC